MSFKYWIIVSLIILSLLIVLSTGCISSQQGSYSSQSTSQKSASGQSVIATREITQNPVQWSGVPDNMNRYELFLPDAPAGWAVRKTRISSTAFPPSSMCKSKVRAFAREYEQIANRTYVSAIIEIDVCTDEPDEEYNAVYKLGWDQVAEYYKKNAAIPARQTSFKESQIAGYPSMEIEVKYREGGGYFTSIVNMNNRKFVSAWVLNSENKQDLDTFENLIDYYGISAA